MITEKEPETGWIGSKVQCDLCTHNWLAVFHESCKQLECPNWGNLSMFEIIEIPE